MILDCLHCCRCSILCASRWQIKSSLQLLALVPVVEATRRMLIGGRRVIRLRNGCSGRDVDRIQLFGI